MSGISIKSAKYGAGSSTTDVTSAVASQVQAGELRMTVNATALNVSDPAPGQNKTLTVNYTINNGSVNTESVKDGDLLSISAPAGRKAEGLKIVKAEYGYTGNFTDVTDAIQNQVSNGSINIKVGFQSAGIPDPNPAKKKTLKVEYSINGSKNTKSLDDGSSLNVSAPADTSNSGYGSSGASQVAISAAAVPGRIFYFTLQFWSAFVFARIGPKFLFGLPWFVWFAIGFVIPVFNWITFPLILVGVGFIWSIFFSSEFLPALNLEAMKEAIRLTT